MIRTTFEKQILPYLQSRKIILAFANERAIQRTADSFEDLGISKSQLFGLIGQSPQCERFGLDIEHTFVALPECTLAFELRAYHNALEQLDATQVAAIDNFDPSREAIVIGAFWFELSSVAHRRVFGYRDPSWIKFEDKCEVSFIWNKAGITQAKSQVITASSLKISLPQGWTYPFVISGDSQKGITGGGSHVRAIYSEELLTSILPFFEEECAKLRLMEYIDGVSCSIHGLVLETEVLTSIPIEMVVIPNSNGKFMYMGASTHWEPLPSEHAHLRDTARKVGNALRKEVNFRGTFTIDGVLKDGTFFPTEINTRAGAGIFALYSEDHTPYFLMDLMIKDGQHFELDPAELQNWMQYTASSNRSTRSWGGAAIDGDCPEETHYLTFDAGQWIRQENEVEGATTLAISEGRTGAFIMLSVDPKTLSKGSLLRPYVKAAMRYSDKVWNTHFFGRC